VRRAALIFVLAVLLLAPGAWAGPKCPPQKRMSRALHETLHEAQKLMEQKKPAQAQAKLAKFAADESNPHPQLSFLLGVLTYQAKQNDKAGKYFAAAMKANPCFRAAIRNLAVVRYEQNRPAEAAELALKAFELSKPPDYNLLYEAAVFYLGAKQVKKALPLLKRLAAQPKPKKSWLTALLQAHMDAKQPRLAEKVLKRLLAGWPGDASLWRLSASLATQRKDYAGAAAALAVAYRLKPPAHRSGWRRLGQLYRAAGAPLAAAPYYLRSFKGKSMGPKDLDLMAGVYLQGHDLKQARHWSQRAAKAKASGRRWARVGRIALEQKDYPAAHKAYVSAAKLEVKGGRHWLMAGYAAWQDEKFKQAAQDFAQAIKQAKDKSTTAKEAARGLKAVREIIKQREQG